MSSQPPACTNETMPKGRSSLALLAANRSISLPANGGCSTLAAAGPFASPCDAPRCRRLRRPGLLSPDPPAVPPDTVPNLDTRRLPQPSASLCPGDTNAGPHPQGGRAVTVRPEPRPALVAPLKFLKFLNAATFLPRQPQLSRPALSVASHQRVCDSLSEWRADLPFTAEWLTGGLKALQR